MPDDLVNRLRRFQRSFFPRYRREFRALAERGQHPTALLYPIAAERVERGALFLHGWHYLIEDGQVMVLDVAGGRFVPAGGAPPDGDALLDLLQ